jgi:ribonuclease Z
MTFSLTILGSNSALPTSKRYPTAQVLHVSERFFLIDCGEGSQLQMRVNRIKFSKIHHVFISHLHGDHCFGLIGFISTLGLLGRTKDLHIYAHKDLERLLLPQLDYFCTELPYSIRFHHLNTKQVEVVFEDRKVEVISFPLKHRIPTCGFLFREKAQAPNIRKEAIQKYQLGIADMASIKRGEPYRLSDGTLIAPQELTKPAPTPRSYAFCSDTAYSPSIVPVIKNVDLLYHEATFSEEHKTLAKKTSHSTAKEAAQIALKAGVKQLLLGHFSNRYDNLTTLEKEAKEVFPHVKLVNEGDVYNIEIKKEG